MSNKLLGQAGVRDNSEANKVDKIGMYLDQLFDAKKEPNGMFLYDREKGGYEFGLVTHSPRYSELSGDEAGAYNSDYHKRTINHYFDEKNPRNIIDMGCGDGEKSATLLTQILGDKLNGKTYIPIDISPYFVDKASKEMQSFMREKNINIKIAGLSLDFLASDSLKDIKDKIYFFLGGSIGNFSDEQIVQILKNMASDSAFGHKSNIVLSYFTEPEDKQKLLATYGDPDRNNPHYDETTSTLTEQRIMNGFQSLNIPTDALEFCVQYDEKNHRVLSGAKVIRSFTITHEGKNYTKQEGEYLWAIQSRRFTAEKMKTLATEAGAHMRHPTEENGVGIAVLEAARSPEAKTKIKSTKKRAVGSAIVAAALAFAVSGGMQIQQKKDKEKEKKEFVKEMGPWMNQVGEGKGMSVLGKSGESDAEMRRNGYEYYRNYMKISYGIDEDKAEEMKKSFLKWLIKAEASNKYSVPGRFGGGESFIHKLNDFIAERGDDYGLAPKDYFGYLGLDEDALRNTFEAPENINESKMHVIKKTIMNKDFYMDVFDSEHSMLGEVGVALIDGKKYIVASHLQDKQYTPLSLLGGRQFTEIYYMNTPGLFNFSQRLADVFQFKEGNMRTLNSHTGNLYMSEAQEQIQKKIAGLLAKGYTFDFYQLMTTLDEYNLGYFAQTFLDLPDSAYQSKEIKNREFFHERNLKPLLNECIKLIKAQHIKKGELTTVNENQLKSTIFHKIYINGSYRGNLTPENVLEELHDEIDKQLNPPPLPGTQNPGETARNMSGGYHGIQ